MRQRVKPNLTVRALLALFQSLKKKKESLLLPFQKDLNIEWETSWKTINAKDIKLVSESWEIVSGNINSCLFQGGQ